MKTRRQFLKTASLGAGAALVNWPKAILAAPQGSDCFRIGVLAPSHCALPLVHAKATGLFAKNGVTTELAFFPDMSDIAKAFAEGDIDMAQLISPVFFALHLGLGPFKGKAQPLVSAQVGGTNGGVLVVGKNSKITSPKKLVGKTIGIHSPMMVHTLVFRALLNRSGIRQDQITLKKIDMKQLIPALKKGEIDAFINPEPLPTFSKLKGVGRDLMTTKTMWFKHPCCVIAMKRAFFEKNTPLAEKLYRSSITGGTTLNNVKTRTGALSLIHQKSKPYGSFPLPALKKAFMPGRSDFDPFPYHSSAEAMLTLMADAKLLPGGTDIAKVASETFLSDISRALIESTGAKGAKANRRKEKIVGRVLAS